MKLAFVFPGQGSQSVGMLATLPAAAPAVAATFGEASHVLGYDLWALCQQGPAAELDETERTQPALLAAGVAVWRAWRARDGAEPAVMAGHSLGELTALVCAGALDFAAAVDLVRFRGEVMQAAVPAGTGAMAAVLGLDDAQVEAACREAAGSEVVVPVNYNSPEQVVIAGHAAAVERAGAACQARGARRVIPLPVSVPSHSPLMQPAAEQFKARLATLTVTTPAIPVHAFDGSWHHSPAAIREGLYRQLFNPVRWSRIMAAMVSSGVTHVVEGGPGKVLTGLARRAPGGRQLHVLAVDGTDSLNSALAACAEEAA